jgi:NDP-sugar pyrophosphorylase family protein
MSLPPVAILAGGLATRLHPVTQTIPKSLVEVAGKPFILHQLEQLRQQGITRVVLCVGNLGDQIVNVLGDGQAYGLDIQYSFDGPVLLGTGGAIQQALPLLNETFFVLYGDSYLQCDYRSLHESFSQSNAQGLMTVYRNDDLWDKSNIVFKDGVIVCYDKHNHTPDMQYIDYGLSLVKRSVFMSKPIGQRFDLADIYQQLVKQKQMAGFEVFTRFYEIGSHQGLAETSAYLNKQK